jgi:DNA-binding transcriptional regulator YiaG
MARIKNAFSGSTLDQVSERFLLELLTKHAESSPGKTGKVLRDLLEDHNVSQSGAARDLGISDRTMRRYIAGDLPLPRVVALALMQLIRMTGGKRPDFAEGSAKR